MKTIIHTARALGLLGVLALFSAMPLDEAGAQSVTLRKSTAGYFVGKIADYANGRLTVHTEEGEILKVTVSSRTKIALLKPADFMDIEEGTYTASAGREMDAENIEAIELRIMEERLRGIGEGYRPFYGSGEEDATMINAKVVTISTTEFPPKILVRFRGKDKNIILPDEVPIMFQSIGDASALVPEAPVSVFTVRSRTTGKIDAVRISIGLDGIQPQF